MDGHRVDDGFTMGMRDMCPWSNQSSGYPGAPGEEAAGDEGDHSKAKELLESWWRILHGRPGKRPDDDEGDPLGELIEARLRQLPLGREKHDAGHDEMPEIGCDGVLSWHGCLGWSGCPHDSGSRYSFGLGIRAVLTFIPRLLPVGHEGCRFGVV